jgi:sialate O-acetylesterase
MFQRLIVDWRKLWNQGDLPFLFIQTANIEQSHEVDKKSDSWCLIREAQQKALSLPETGMAVSLDMGDPFDVHPKNKQEFGHRLALQAYRAAYHLDVIADAPVYESNEIKGDTVVVWFRLKNGQLEAKNRLTLGGFEISGKDGLYHQALACLRNNKVYVFSEKVKHPIEVRYAWTNNPCCSLFNESGLPVAPFQTNGF